MGKLTALLLISISGVACDRVETGHERVVVAWLDDRPLTLEDWQRYLDANLLETAPGDRVQSRLFDAFVDERLLLAEAGRRGLSATDLEVEAWLRFAGGRDEQPVTPERREEARRRVMIQKLEEVVATELPDVGAAEPAGAGDPAPAGRVVRLSSLRFDDRELAEQVAKDVARGSLSFDEALISHGSPQDGVPVDRAWERLQEQHRAALEGLRVGQVSAPVEIAGEVFVFRVEAWLDGAAAGAVRDEQARRGIESARRGAAFAALLTALRKKSEMRIEAEVLPFTYVADNGNS